MAADVRVGLELDGTTATAVTVEDGTVADIKTVSAATPEDAVTAVLAGVRSSAPVRATLVTDGVLVSRVDVTAASLTADAFADLAYAATRAPREGTTIAALLLDPDGVRAGLLGAGIAAAAPADPVTRLYRALEGRGREVVPAAFTAGTLEGVSLALRHTSADLTLVVDGEPVAHQQLRSGGLAVVEAVLGGGTSAGEGRLQAALGGSSATRDPMAAAALERYLRQVLTDARDVLDGWSRRGERTSREIYVYGPGARARALDVLMADLHLVRADNRATSQALVHLPPSERPAAVAAYLAAATYGRHMPYAAFVQPDRVHEVNAEARRRRVRRRVVTLTVAGALVAAGLLGPAAAGVTVDLLASRDLATAQDELESVGAAGTDAADLVVLEEAAAKLGDSRPWALLLPAVHSAAPAGVTVTSVVAQATDGTNVRVAVSGQTGTDVTARVAAYASALRRSLAVTDLVPSSTSAADGTATFTVAFTVEGGSR